MAETTAIAWNSDMEATHELLQEREEPERPDDNSRDESPKFNPTAAFVPVPSMRVQLQRASIRRVRPKLVW